MKMDALVKRYDKRGLWLERVDVPQASQGQAVIRILKTAICGTDVHIYEWDEWSRRTVRPPLILGHEFVGEIVEIKGEGFSVGDLVSGEGHIVCGKCHACRSGKAHLCALTRGTGVNKDGIFAQYAVMPICNLYKCRKDIDLELYPLFDPLGNATHAALSYRLLGEDVLITGAGPIGIMAAAIAKFSGARSVVITDIQPYRLELAKSVCGSVVAVNTQNEDLGAVMSALGIEGGFGVGLEMSGSGNAFNQMLSCMKNGGNIALLGILDNRTNVNWDKIIFGCLKIKGIYGREMYESWRQMTAMLQGGLDISNIITHRFDYKDFEKGFELMSSGMSGKIILNWA